MTGSHGERLEDVGAPSDATIDGDRNLAISRDDTSSECVESRRDTIQLSTTMIRHDDTVKTVLDGQLDILGSVHTLDPELELGVLAQPGNGRVPVERRVKVMLALR